MIQSVTINAVHGFNNFSLELKFPVCAIVGENGTGKTTILKLLACAYKNTDRRLTLYPSKFFPETTWEKLGAVSIKYTIKQGTTITQPKIHKPTKRWIGLKSRPINRVYYFDLSRTTPIESSVGYAKLAKQAIKEVSSRDLPSADTNKISDVMGRTYNKARFAKTNIDSEKEVGLLTVQTSNGATEISQFHQGAGESTVEYIISAITEIPDTSLVILDEIESSLHPTSQRRLVRQLLELARVKTLQVVVSTHSPYVLSELPEDARVLLSRTSAGVNAVYGPSVEMCLTEIDETPHAELDVLVEDDESKMIVLEIIRASNQNDLLKRIQVVSAGSGPVIRSVAQLAQSNEWPYNTLCIVDADQAATLGLIKLPGTLAPEKQVISDIATLTDIPDLERLLNKPASDIRQELTKVQTSLDHHEWLQKLESQFSYPKNSLWQAFVQTWVRQCLTEGNRTIFCNAVLGCCRHN